MHIIYVYLGNSYLPTQETLNIMFHYPLRIDNKWLFEYYCKKKSFFSTFKFGAKKKIIVNTCGVNPLIKLPVIQTIKQLLCLRCIYIYDVKVSCLALQPLRVRSALMTS